MYRSIKWDETRSRLRQPRKYRSCVRGCNNRSTDSAERPYPGTPRQPFFAVLIANLPYAFALGIWAFIAFRREGKLSQAFLRPPPRSHAPILLTIVLAGSGFLITLAATALQYPTPPLDPTEPSLPPFQALANVLLIFLPFVAIAGGGLIFFLVSIRHNISRIWELQPHLALPQTIEIDDDGLAISDAVSRSHYQWESFVGWHNTPRLYLLYRSYIGFEMIPKRAFANPQDALDFLSVLRQRIGDVQHGFQPNPPPMAPPPLPMWAQPRSTTVPIEHHNPPG